MVRINRTYSIEHNLVEKLKEENNNSELINNLLEAHFNRASSKDLQHLKKELDSLENNIDALRRERDRKADIIRNLENKANLDNNLVIKEKEEKKKNKEAEKFLFSLIDKKELTFDEYMIFKNAPKFLELRQKLFLEEITLEEFKKAKQDYLDLGEKKRAEIEESAE